MNSLLINKNTRGKLVIRKRSLLHWLIFLISFWWWGIKLAGMLPGPLGYIKYLPDGVLLLLLILNAGRSRIAVRRDSCSFLLLTVGYFLYALAVYCIRFQSPFYFLWGSRNNFRFYIAFFAFISFLDSEDVESWYNTVEILFWTNGVLSVVQFTLMGIKGDFLGGIFGISGASNAYTLLLLSVVVVRSLLQTFSGRENSILCLGKCVVSLLIAAMAELKFYFVLFILILVMSAALSRFSTKGIVLLVVGAVAVIWSTSLVSQWFESGIFFNMESLVELATKENYSSKNDLNRLSAIPTLMKIVVTDPMERLFGLGLGNCDTSSFAICNTPFYQRYNYLHYTWFTAAMIFLETGLVGCAIHLLFFAMAGLKSYRRSKVDAEYVMDNQLVFIMAMLCCVLTFYNSSLRTEAGYMVYFVFAIPYIRLKKKARPAHAAFQAV